MVRFFSAFLAVALVSLLPAQTPQKSLASLKDEYWDFALRERPDLGLVAGEVRYNDRLPDYSLAHVKEVQAREEQTAEPGSGDRCQSFGRTGSTGQGASGAAVKGPAGINSLEDLQMPVDQFNGVQIWLPQIATLAPFDTVRHYQDWIARLHQVPRVLNQVTEVLQQGVRDKLMPPKYLLEKAVEQTRDLANTGGLANPFAVPATHIPA